MIFDFQDKVIFPAGKEFRHLDIRTFRHATEKVVDIYKVGDHYDVMLFKEEPRVFKNFQTYKDINGDFVIENLEDRHPDLQGDYASVFFSLGVSQEYFDSDIYIFGKLSDYFSYNWPFVTFTLPQRN